MAPFVATRNSQAGFQRGSKVDILLQLFQQSPDRSEHFSTAQETR
jgi:hypothetical protein